MTSLSCPACGGLHVTEILHVPKVPVHQNVLADSLAEALACARGDIDLRLCADCGFVFNAAFDEALMRYAPAYENSQTHSPYFRSYLDALAARLTRRHHLAGKTVVEIGCGKGEFLSRLCAAAGCRGLGFDPSYVAERDGVAPGVTIVSRRYEPEAASLVGDLICARHVIEHLARPGELLRAIRGAVGDRPDVGVFFETPRLEWILEHAAFWDLCYEHSSYFSMPVLGELFRRNGFEVTEHLPAFGDQYQWLETRPVAPGGAPRPPEAGALAGLAQAVRAFAAACTASREAWRARVSELARRGPCAVWGAAAKGVIFLNVLGLDAGTVPLVVDINPRKQGRHVPGTGQRVIAPTALRAHGVRSVLVMNPNYAEEIRGQLQAENLDPELIVL